MKQKVFFITEKYPFGHEEDAFVVPELDALVSHFDVSIYTCTAKSDSSDYKDANIDNTCIKAKKIYTSFSVRNLSELYNVISCGIKALFDNELWKEVVRTRKRKIPLSILRDLIFFDMCAFRYEKILRHELGNKIDDAIIYTFWNNTFTLAALRLKRDNNNLKVVSRIHGYDLFEERTRLKVWQPFKTCMDEKIDAIFFISEQGQKYYVDRFANGRMNSKYFLNYMGVSPKDCINSIDDEHIFQIVSCSRAIKLKRIELIIEALSRIDASYAINWTHFGDGDCLQDLKTLSESKLKSHLNISYDFKGFINNEELMNYYRSIPIDVFILTSETEGLPVSIMEALSFGIPVIATNVGGVSEELSNNNGVLLSDKLDADEIADAIKYIYDLDKDAVLNMRKNSYELWKKKFNTQKNMSELIKILENI